MKKLNCFVIISLILILSLDVFAERRLLGGASYKRAGNSKSSQWTLADWMTQKQNFRFMDQWLAFNTTLSNFELDILGGKQNYDVRVGGNVTQQVINRYGVSMYWSIFGLTYLHESSDEKFTKETYQFNLRLIGTTSRSTHLDASYGQQKLEFENPVNSVTNQFAGAKLNLYIVSFMGIDGNYKKYFRAKDLNSQIFEGDRSEYGVFVDVSMLRIYGRIFRETTYKTPAGGALTSEVRDGSEAGVSLYF